jgi:ubiquinone/menaquinone biosynthesis C-methylase UbiE
MQISPVNRSKSAAREAYDRMSSVYDLLAGSSETPLMRRGLEMLAVGEGESVLEIGCGTGKAQVELCNRVGAAGRLFGIDLSPGMLQQTRDHLEKAGLRNRVTLLESDGAHLPFQSACFTSIFLSFTLELFDTPEIPLVLAECWRVLLSGGRLGVVSMQKTDSPSWIVRLYEWFHAHLPAYVDCRPIEAHAMVQAAGFNLEKRETRSMWGLPVDIICGKKR